MYSDENTLLLPEGLCSFHILYRETINRTNGAIGLLRPPKWGKINIAPLAKIAPLGMALIDSHGGICADTIFCYSQCACYSAEMILPVAGDNLSNNDIDFLDGGRENAIKRAGKKVYRPAQKWTPIVHNFLKALRENGFNSAPIPFEITDAGEEVVSYIDGDVYNDELPVSMQGIDTLLSIAKMMRSFHNASIPFLSELKGDEPWMLTPRTPVEVMCHGDIAPYNVVMAGKRALGIIDFDTIHPGPRIWDIAYTVYRWVPLMSPENPESYGNKAQQLKRLELFLTEYSALNESLSTVLETVISRLAYNVEFMEEKARDGDEGFQQCLDEGHHLGYLRDIEYVQELIESLS